jgi:WD40 repeat protein
MTNKKVSIKSKKSFLLETIKMKYPLKNLLLLEQVNLIIGDASPIITIWNLKLKAQIQQLRGHVSQVSALIQVRDSVLASGSFDCSIKIWNSANGQLLKNLTDHTDRVYGLALVKKSQSLISCSEDTTIKMWNTTSGINIRTLTGHQEYVFCICVFSDRSLASTSGDKTIRIWNTTNRKDIKTLQYDQVIFSFIQLSNEYFACGESDSLIKIRNLTSGLLVIALSGHTLGIQSLIEIKSIYLASASYDGTIKIWNHVKGKCLQTLEGHFISVYSLVLLNNFTLLSGSLDKTLKKWHLIEILSSPTNKVEYYCEYIAPYFK